MTGTRVVFVGWKPGNFPLTGSDLPSHWFVWKLRGNGKGEGSERRKGRVGRPPALLPAPIGFCLKYHHGQHNPATAVRNSWLYCSFHAVRLLRISLWMWYGYGPHSGYATCVGQFMANYRPTARCRLWPRVVDEMQLGCIG